MRRGEGGVSPQNRGAADGRAAGRLLLRASTDIWCCQDAGPRGARVAPHGLREVFCLTVDQSKDPLGGLRKSWNFMWSGLLIQMFLVCVCMGGCL